MVDVLVALVTVLALVVVVLLFAGAVTLLPMLVTHDLAAGRGRDPLLWGAISLAASLLGLAVTAKLASDDTLLALPFVLLTWAGPALVRLLPARTGAAAHVVGAHR